MEEQDNRSRGQGRTAVSFPPDVWRIIAGHLTLNEWARISGTCKTTWQLQLDELHLTWRQGFHAAGARWVVRRAQQAHMMKFGPLADGEQIDAAANALLQTDNTWASLKAATITLLSARTWPHSTAEVISLNSAIVWFLRSAASLDYLFLRTQELRCMPRLAQLRHLQLSLRENFCAVAQSLSNLTNLETLSLDQAHRVSPDKEADFDLTGIDKLQTVMLTNVVPASLLLPRGAALHVWMRCWGDAHAPIWQSVASALEFFWVGNDTMESVILQLPDILLVPSGLKTIIVDVDTLGTPAAPIVLCGPLLQVECLILQCTGDMNIRVPSGTLAWQRVKFLAWGSLSIDFDSVGDFLDSCPAFSIAYGSLHRLDMMHLCHFIAERGIQWASIRISATGIHDEYNEFHSLCTPSLMIGPYMGEYEIRQFTGSLSCSLRGSCLPGALDFQY